jgi:site-specific DNA recombinase
VPLHPNLSRPYREKVAALHELLADETTRTEAVEIIRSLIDRIILWPAESGALEVELVGISRG